jgi:rhodanese-related sulfurtransferase
MKKGFDTRRNTRLPIDNIKSISVHEFAEIKDADNTIEVLDVRKKSEHFSEQIENTINIPLDYINKSMHLIDKNKTYYVHCAGGFRSMVFVFILKAHGYDKLIDVEGGLSAIKASNKFKVTDYICPTSML